MTRGARGRANISGVRGREVVDGPRSRDVLEGGRSRQVLLGPRGRNTGGLHPVFRDESLALWLDSKYSVSGEPRVINRGVGDRTGVSGAVIYDGKAVLPGQGFGSATNHLTVASFDVPSDIDIIMRVQSDAWDGANTSVRLVNSTSSLLDLQYNQTTRTLTASAGGAGRTAVVPGSVVDGDTIWLRMTRDFSDNETIWYWAEDQPTVPTSWTTLSTGTAYTITPATGTLAIGNYIISALDRVWPGDIYRTIIKDGIDGTTVLDVDLTNVPNWSSSFTATTGQTVTLTTTAADYGAPSALDAKYGSVLGAYVYDGAAVLPAAATIGQNKLSIPDAPDQSGFTSMEFVVRLAPDEWNPAVTQNIVCKRTAVVGDLSFSVSLQSPGVWLGISADGSTWAGGTIVLPVSEMGHLVDGEASWLKVVWDGGSTDPVGQVHTFTAPDQPTEPTTWATTYSGSGFAVGAVTHDSAQPIRIGSHETAEQFRGEIYRTIVRGDGTTVLDVDLTNVADYATSFTATTGQTVTVNSTSSDTNDPLLLTHTGENYVYLPATGTSYLSTPNEASFDLGTMQVIARFSTAKWGDAEQFVVSNLDTSAKTGFEFGSHTSNNLRFTFYSSGSTLNSQASASIAGIADNDVIWAKAVLAPSGLSYYWAQDQPTVPTSWTQLGTENVSVAGRTVVTPTLAVRLGDRPTTASPLEGRIYHVQFGSVDGDPVFEFNAPTDITDAGATSFTATSGQTVTVNRATSGRKTALVTRPVWLFGTDDYLEVADNALLDFAIGEGFTVMAVWRAFATVGEGPIISKSGVTYGQESPSWSVYSANRLRLRDGAATTATTPGTTTTSAGVLSSMIGFYDPSTNQITSVVNGVAGTPISTLTLSGSLANSTNVRIGAQASGAVYSNGEYVAVAVWRRVLTGDEIAAINTYYGTV